MDGRRRRRVKEAFDLGVGFLGFFTAAFFVITLGYEIARQDALGWALTTLVLALATAGMWLGRRAALQHVDRLDRIELGTDDGLR